MAEVPTRRRVLAWGLFLAIVAPLGWVLSVGVRAWGPWWIRWRLRYLDLSQVDLDAYLEQYAYYKGLDPAPGLADDLVTRLLLSTDFFHEGADEARALEYRGFYYPEVLPCANPFAASPPSGEDPAG